MNQEVTHAARRGKTYRMAMTALMAAVTCVIAPMAIPIGPVPISFTNLAIYLSLYLLGWKRGTVSYLVYVLIGAVGVPVFSGFTGGLGKLAGATVTHGDGYPGWAPNPDSEILKVAQETYKRLFDKEPQIKAIHAGLECGLFLEKYPYLDMISFGPTLRDVHSPNERIQIDTVGLWWSHLLELLKSIPAK